MNEYREEAVARVDARRGSTVEFSHSPEAHQAEYEAEEVTLIEMSDPQMRVLAELAEADRKQPRQWNANRWQPLSYTLSRQSELSVIRLEQLGLIETNAGLAEQYDDWRPTRGTGARITDKGHEYLGTDDPHPPKLTKKEFIKQFKVPEDTTLAFKFGRNSAYYGHAKLSFAQFFRNDQEVRIETVTRSSLWRAYLRGVEVGRQQRRTFDAKKAEEEDDG